MPQHLSLLPYQPPELRQTLPPCSLLPLTAGRAERLCEHVLAHAAGELPQRLLLLAQLLARGLGPAGAAAALLADGGSPRPAPLLQ